jgi:mRNA-degrading endonuclease RelE of RelBE toxin-antitoxin system
VCYRIDEDKHAVIVLDIVPRADAYDPGRAER